MANLGKHLVIRPKEDTNPNAWFWAVEDLSFEIPRGITLGIIGPNGAGKTTTLKLLSWITKPTAGSVHVNGRISALIELGAGFHPDLTGRENVYLNGTILGMRRHEITDKYDAIVKFAELSRFMDTPVKYFSSGMYARLGFSVAAHTNPDVLLVDEVLAVGDYAFQQRCYEQMRILQDQGTTIVLVSHNLAVIAEVCEEVIVLYQGKSVFHGEPALAVAEYADLIRRKSTKKSDLEIGRDGIGMRLMTHGAEIVEVSLIDNEKKAISTIGSGKQVKLVATVLFHEDASHPNFSCFVRDERGRTIYDQTTSWQGIVTPSYKQGDSATITFVLDMNVIEGLYNIGIDLHYHDLSCYYDRLETAASVFVHGGQGAKGIADLNCKYIFEELK